MPTPKPWSFSSLDNFTTCARKYHEEVVLKTVPRVETPAQAAGIRAHKAFEDRIAIGRQLPDDLREHEPLMVEIEREVDNGAKIFTERKVALNRRLQPCQFFSPDVWWRGVIDVEIRRPDKTVRIVDYKNGKKKPKVDQLKLFSIYGIITGAETVESFFYWIQDKTRTAYTMPALALPALLQGFVPDLNEYADAYLHDVWPPKRNGLCAAYCGVVGCEYRGLRMNE